MGLQSCYISIAIFKIIIVFHFSEDDNIEEEVEKNNRETTIQYMAPEVLELYQRKRKALNDIQSYTRADIYSFGLVLWELCMATHMDVASHKDLHEVRFQKITLQGDL